MFLVMNEELVGGILGPIGIVMMLGMIGYSMLQLQGDERSRMLAGYLLYSLHRFRSGLSLSKPVRPSTS
jgi:hypothetical protein